MLNKFIIIVFLQSLSFSIYSANILHIPLPRSRFDISHDYYTKLLTLALEKGANGREVPELTAIYPMQQGRALKELIKGDKLDVFWFGTDKDKEQQLKAIKIPLERGLMGFRKLIIRKDKLALFENITTLKQLKNLVACQGTHWPDTKILHAADLPVLSSPVYENLFLQVNFGRCDYFPRGVHEGGAEIKQRKKIYKDLILYNNLIIHYPFTVYFFVNKNNKELAKWIEDGLLKAIADGSFEQHIKTHPLTAHVFPLKKWMNVPTIEIPNPELSKDTNFHDAKYWIQSLKK
jgi:hypothetical protein